MRGNAVKRIVICLLALCLLAGCTAAAPEPSKPTTTQPEAQTYPGFPEAPETFAGMTEAALQPYFELAQETYKRYIEAECVHTRNAKLPQFPLEMSPPLQKYTQLRFNAVTERISFEPIRSIETDMGNWEIIEGKLLCSPCVRVKHYNDSGFGAWVQMLIENPRNPMLADWFDPDKGSWDRQVREGHYNLPDDADPWAVYQWPASWNLSDPENWLGNCELKIDLEV